MANTGQIRSQSSLDMKNDGGIFDLLLRAASIIYYFLYFMFKGRESSNNEQVLCIANKPAASTADSHSLSPTETNVCCLHGVQSRARDSIASVEEEEAGKRPIDGPAKIKDGSKEGLLARISGALTEKNGPQSSPFIFSSHTSAARTTTSTVTCTSTISAMKNHFEKLAEKKTELIRSTNGLFEKYFKSGKAVTPVANGTEPVPVPPAPRAYKKQKEQPQQSLIGKTFNYFGSFFRQKPKQLPEPGPVKPSPEVPEVPIAVPVFSATGPQEPPAPPGAAPRPPPPPPPGPGTRVPTSSRQTESVEPKYPAALFSEKASASVNSAGREIPVPIPLSERLRPLKEIDSELKTIFAQKARSARQQKEPEPEEEEEEEEEATETDHLKYIRQSRKAPVLQFAKSHDRFQTPQKAQVTIKTIYDDTRDEPFAPSAARASAEPVFKGTAPSTRPISIRSGDEYASGDHGGESRVYSSSSTNMSRNYERRHERSNAPSLSPRAYRFDTGGSSPIYAETPEKQQQYKKYTRYMYRSSSSYHSADDNDQEERLLKKVRNPLGDVHDYQQLSREYGENLATNMASPEKCHELSHLLSSEQEHGKGAEMFHKRRQSAEEWVVDEKPPLPKPSPSATSKKPIVDEIIDSVREAAARKEDVFRPIQTKVQTRHVADGTLDKRSFHTSSLTNLVDRVVSKPPAWEHEHLFSPVPFAPAQSVAHHRPFTPIDFGGRRSAAPGDEFKPETVTTSVIAITTPSTRIVTSVIQTPPSTTTLSGFNTLPKSWRSFSEAYKQHHAS